MMSVSTTTALQGAAGAAAAASGATVVPYRQTRSDTELLQRIASRLVTLSGNTREYPGINDAELFTQLQGALAQQNGGGTPVVFTSRSDTVLLQYLAGAVGVNGSEVPFQSLSNTKLLRFCVGAIKNPATGEITQLFTPAIQSLTNAQKLLLSPSSPTDGTTKVSVSDVLRLSGAGEAGANGDYVPIGTNPTYSDSIVYKNFVTGYCIGYGGFRTDPNGGGANTLQWGVFRTGGASDGSDLADPAYYGQTDPTIGPDDGSWDWQPTATSDIPPFGVTPAPTTILGAIQQLAAPSTAQGAVAVFGGIQNGIYPKRGLNGGKSYFNLLGADDDPNGTAISWNDGLNRWYIQLDGDDTYYYSESNVATPDLASNWKYAQDGMGPFGLAFAGDPAPITVTSVSVGELNAGATIAGAGTPEANGVLVGPTVAAGDPGNYGIGDVIGATPNGNRAFFNGTEWSVGAIYFGGYSSTQNRAFPWQLTDLIPDDGDAPAPTVTRNDVATEANWVPV